MKSNLNFTQKSKKYLRKKAVAERYSCDERTVDRMKLDGRIPPPIYLGNKFPLWEEAALDESDRKAVLAGRKG
jgi:predicted DNA-binding transcriptional regulator AlpA